MTPAQEKAQELVDRFKISNHLIAADNKEDAKLCALICVEEELKGLFELKDKLDDEIFGVPAIILIHQIADLEEVKQEIEKI